MDDSDAKKVRELFYKALDEVKNEMAEEYNKNIEPKKSDVNDDKELDEYIDKLQRTTSICINLDWIREYTKFNCPEGSWARDCILAMLETWRFDMLEED